jgi:formate hydrogenlyase subunit 3/multisubunit Na+/H+ antiporter MnhD subunit
MVMQVLAWMWCIIFGMSVGSITVFGVSAVAHALLIGGVFITVGVFETARRKPNYFGGLGRGNGGEHE